MSLFLTDFPPHDTTGYFFILGGGAYRRRRGPLLTKRHSLLQNMFSPILDPRFTSKKSSKISTHKISYWDIKQNGVMAMWDASDAINSGWFWALAEKRRLYFLKKHTTRFSNYRVKALMISLNHINWLVFLYSLDGQCSLRGTIWVFKCNSG
jgi:hypothetical protein